MVIDPAIIGVAAALAVGLIVGLERGWSAREQADGGRVAGLRTYALIGLLGGVLTNLNGAFGAVPVASGLFALALLTALSYREEVRASGSLSATSAVAVLLTYALGVLAASGAPALALGIAVVAAVLLDQKTRLHGWLKLMDDREFGAALQILVLSAVVLPLLPDRGYGPYDALNPYRLWWAVVLVAALSFAGHVAMRAVGPQRGMLLGGLLGGLVSSTAATLTLSRRARLDPGLAGSALAGIVAACGVMFLRMAVLVVALQPSLSWTLAPALVVSGAALLVHAALQSHRQRPVIASTPAESAAPFDLSAALFFGAFLGALAVLVRAAQEQFGAAGLYALAGVSGLADVDGIVISVTHMLSTGVLPLKAGAIAVGLAAASNMLSKAGIAWWIAGPSVGRRVAVSFLAATIIGSTLGAVLVHGF